MPAVRVIKAGTGGLLAHGFGCVFEGDQDANRGMLALNDAESGKRYLIDSSRSSVRNSYKEKAGHRTREINALFGSTGIDSIDISTARSYVEPLIHFFKRRKMRRAPRA